MESKKEEPKHIYETIVIFHPGIAKDKTRMEKIMNKYRTLLQNFSKEKKLLEDTIGTRKLAYEIHGLSSGVYMRYLFQAVGSNITELEKTLRIDSNVLKFMTVKADDYDDVPELEDLRIFENSNTTKSEQKPDALDVLLGFANY